MAWATGWNWNERSTFNLQHRTPNAPDLEAWELNGECFGVLQKRDKQADLIWQAEIVQIMKTKLCIGIVLFAAMFARAQTTNLTALLQQGLLEEQASRNLPAAISNYQALAAQFDQDRQLAATAIFRIGECYRMEGRTNEAAAQYQRILSDFADQTTLATLSRQNLAGMGVTSPPMIAAESPDTALWNKVKNLNKDKLPGILPTLVSDPVLDTLLQQRNEAATKVAQLKVDYAPDSLRVVSQQTVVDEINRQIDQKVVGIMQALKMRSELSPTTGSEAGKDVSGPSVRTTSDEDQEIQRIQQMIQNSPDLINAVSGGSTPLVKAAYNGWIRVATYLLDHGANVNVACFHVPGREDLLNLSSNDNAPHFTSLMAAVMAGNRAMTQFLIDHGADVNFQGQNGETSLDVAVQKGFQAVVEVLLANKADVNAQNSSGCTPLFLAAQNNNPKIVSLLLEHKANVDIQDQFGRTPLSEAARLNFPEIVKLLLAADANPNVENKDGRAPLSFAAGNGSPETVKMLLAAKADPNGGGLDVPLLYAIHANNAAVAKLLLEAGANPNAKGKVDWRVQIGRIEYVGGGQNAQVTPLWLAISINQPPMVRLLLKYKADPNDSQTDRRSLLFSALGSPDILNALLDAGAKVDARDETDRDNNTIYRRTALMMAASGANKSNAVEILLQHGADAKVCDSQGRAALHWAACNAPADESVFVLLLNAKADPNVRDNYGKTPLDYIKSWFQNDWKGRFETVAAKQELAKKLIILLHQHGALDKLPNWDAITVSRPSANFSQTVFQQGTNDWNQFTLLETIFNFYSAPSVSSGSTFQSRLQQIIGRAGGGNGKLPFPDLTHVTIVRPSHDSTNETRIEANLLNSTNGIDGAKDVPLQFGDVVEIPELDHALGDSLVGLTGSQHETIADCLQGKVQLVTHGQKVELPIYPTADGSLLTSVIRQSAAQKILLSSSDLSRVKVIRHDAKTGKQQEWIVDCSDQGSSANGNLPISYQWSSDANTSSLATGLWLRAADVIEVPEKR